MSSSLKAENTIEENRMVKKEERRVERARRYRTASSSFQTPLKNKKGILRTHNAERTDKGLCVCVCLQPLRVKKQQGEEGGGGGDQMGFNGQRGESLVRAAVKLVSGRGQNTNRRQSTTQHNVLPI